MKTFPEKRKQITMRMISPMLLFMALLFLGISCNKKFDHNSYSESAIPQDCPLCDYADSISGSFKGKYFSYAGQDSIVVELEHVFLSLSPKIDSTKMFFKMIRHYNNGDSFEKVVSLDNYNGLFYNTSYGNKMYLEGDSLHYEEGYSHKMGFTPVFFFDGKRIP